MEAEALASDALRSGRRQASGVDKLRRVEPQIRTCHGAPYFLSRVSFTILHASSIFSGYFSAHTPT